MSCPYQVQENSDYCGLCGKERVWHVEAPLLYESATQAKNDRGDPRFSTLKRNSLVERIIGWFLRL